MTIYPIFIIVVFGSIAVICNDRYAKNPRKNLVWAGWILAAIPLLLLGFGVFPVSGENAIKNIGHGVILPFILGMGCLWMAAYFYNLDGTRRQKKQSDVPIKIKNAVEVDDPDVVDQTSYIEESDQQDEAQEAEAITLDEVERRKAATERKSRYEKAKEYLRMSMKTYTEGERNAAVEVLYCYYENGCIIPCRLPISKKEEISNEDLVLVGGTVFFLLSKEGKYNRDDCAKFLKSVFSIPLEQMKEDTISKKLPGRNRVESLLAKIGKE